MVHPPIHILIVLARSGTEIHCNFAAGFFFFFSPNKILISKYYKIPWKWKLYSGVLYACKKPYVLPKTTQACKKRNSVNGMMSLWTLDCWTKRNISSLVYQPQPRTRHIQISDGLHCKHIYSSRPEWGEEPDRYSFLLRYRVTHSPTLPGSMDARPL